MISDFFAAIPTIALATLLALLLSASHACAAEPVIWLEAELFDNTGGWSNDSQFVDVMGSPYLLATGLGKPVPDAVTQARVPQTGSYQLWVRCKDWLPEHHPGEFQVVIGQRPAPTIFGRTDSDAWQWIHGGVHELKAGTIEVRLRDRTGWWARCDAIVLALGEFEPADDLDALARQRERFGGVSAAFRDREYDVVVVGGGLAGCAAALSAARHGCEVALLQDRPVLGGNASTEIQVPAMGRYIWAEASPFEPEETGIIEEFHPEVRTTGRSAEIEAILRTEPNLDLFLNTRATGVEMADDKTIATAIALSVKTGQRLRFRAPLFVDCTGHGWIGYWAGATCSHGRESREEFGESLAPPEGDRLTMGNDLYHSEFREHDEPVAFEAPDWAYQWTKPEDFEPAGSHARLKEAVRPGNFDRPSRGKGRQPSVDDPDGGIYHTWWVEYGGVLDTIRDAEKIRDELFRINIGLWDYAKNHNPIVRERNANRELVWLNYVAGVRESRRIMGDYIMTQHDFEDRIVHPDTVAYTDWGIDTHHPEGFWVRGVDVFHCFKNVRTSIPYRSLYSKDIANLFMAGRCHSATHIAFSGTRIMRTMCLTGQAAGTAAAIAHREDTTPRGVYKQHLDDLQQALLRDGCYLMGVPNRDPEDLALTAQASASSSMTFVELPKRPGGGLVHALDVDRAVMFPAPTARINSVAFHLKSSRDEVVRVRVALRNAEQLGDFSSEADLAEAHADVPAKSDGWVEFPLGASVEPGRHYYLCLPATPGVAWYLFPHFPPDHCRAYHDKSGWQRRNECYTYRLTPGGAPEPPAVADPVLLAPHNVNNGWNRLIGNNRNAWAPDPAQPLPQWVQLDLLKPARVNCIHISFQNAQYRADAFRINARIGSAWQPVAEVTNNTLRRRVIRFDSAEADAIRLVLLSAPKPAAVCEVRVYEQRD